MAIAAPVSATLPPARPPGYYVRRRLLRNQPAMLGLGFIVLCTLVAVLGYWVLPDNTPNANNSLVALQKQPPGLRVNVLRIPLPDSARSAARVGLLGLWWGGQPSPYREVPIEAQYRTTPDSLFVRPFQTYRSAGAARVAEQGVALASLTKNRLANSTPQFIAEQAISSRTYLLGTDKAGRDELSRLLLGTRISLGIGLVAVLISVLLGMAIGAVAGYVGGWVDSLLLGLMTVVWSIPGIMLVIAISLALDSKGVWTSFVAVGLTMWVDVARVVRGQMLSLREKTFVEAGRVLGLPQSRLIWRHLLPNMTGPLIVLATSNFAAAILLEAGLSFLGLGVQPPAPSWGLMVNEGFQLLGTEAGLWLTLLPGLAISLLVLSFNLLGNGLRDAYDPKTPVG
ncbi:MULTISPECIES: ABC transporter permease [Hymenobacter]|nr:MULTISPECIES: ABC transporter permease [Hymenobacter]UOQ82474.1 ABC transporter permease [Hymenobacter sp. 5414T-23]